MDYAEEIELLRQRKEALKAQKALLVEEAKYAPHECGAHPIHNAALIAMVREQIIETDTKMDKAREENEMKKSLARIEAKFDIRRANEITVARLIGTAIGTAITTAIATAGAWATFSHFFNSVP